MSTLRFIPKTALRKVALAAAILGGAALLAPAAQAFTLPPDGSGPIEMLTVLHVKPVQFHTFMQAMEANVEHSRREPGNVGFDVFQPVTGKPTLYVLEQWADPKFTRAHLKAGPLIAMHKAAAVSLEGVISPMVLAGVTAGTGIVQESRVADRAGSVNAIAIVSAKKGTQEAQDAKDVLRNELDLSAQSVRGASGNLSYDVFASKSDDGTLVVLSRWESKSAYQASLKLPEIKTLNGVYGQTLTKPWALSNVMVKDITLGH